MDRKRKLSNDAQIQTKTFKKPMIRIANLDHLQNSTFKKPKINQAHEKPLFNPSFQSQTSINIDDYQTPLSNNLPPSKPARETFAKKRCRKNAVIKQVTDLMDFWLSDTNLWRDRYLSKFLTIETEQSKLKPIPLSTFVNFSQFRKVVGVDESTSSCLKILQRAVEGSGVLFRSDSLMVQRINPIVERMPSTDVLEGRTIYLDGFPLPDEIVMQSRLLAKNGEKSGNTYFDYDNNIMQLPEKKAAEQFIDHAFIKKSIVHFAKCQSEDIALVRYNAVFGYAFVEFSRDMDLEHICIRLSHKNTVWRRRNEPIRPLYKFINDNFTSGSSFSHENTKNTRTTQNDTQKSTQNNTHNITENTPRSKNLPKQTTNTGTLQESTVPQSKKRHKVQENMKVTKFCSFKVRAITMYQWMDLNKTCARLQTGKWGKAKSKLSQEVKRCKQRDMGQLGITFDDDMDNYTIRAVSTILEGTPARMMGYQEDGDLEDRDLEDFNEGFQVLNQSDSESVENSEKSDVLSLGESEHENDEEAAKEKENGDSWRQNSQTSDFSETENNKIIERIRDGLNKKSDCGNFCHFTT